MNLEKSVESLEEGEELCCQSREKGAVPLPERDSYIKVLVLEENIEKTETKRICLKPVEISLGQYWPKPESNLRKTEFPMPSNAVMIHESKYRMGKPPAQPFSPGTSLLRWQCTLAKSHMWERARGNKRNNKKGKTSLDVSQSTNVDAQACTHAHTESLVDEKMRAEGLSLCIPVPIGSGENVPG